MEQEEGASHGCSSRLPPCRAESCLAGFPGAASWPPELMETLRGPGFGREICSCPASAASDLSTLMFYAFRKKCFETSLSWFFNLRKSLFPVLCIFMLYLIIIKMSDSDCQRLQSLEPLGPRALLPPWALNLSFLPRKPSPQFQQEAEVPTFGLSSVALS